MKHYFSFIILLTFFLSTARGDTKPDWITTFGVSSKYAQSIFVTGFGMFSHCAVKREPADRERNRVSQDDPEHSADESDGKSFGEKLQEDVTAARAQGFFNADLAGALRYRDQHDVHETNSADA